MWGLGLRIRARCNSGLGEGFCLGDDWEVEVGEVEVGVGFQHLYMGSCQNYGP